MATLTLGRVLVVDDEIKLMTTLCETLAEHGYEASGYPSGREALEAMKSQSFDLLLTDLMMPEMDGIALLHAVLEIDPYTIGIIMTGEGTVQTAVEAMKLGAFDYILKPFQLQTILSVLSRAIEVRRLRLENVQLREIATLYDLTKTLEVTLDLNTILYKIADLACQQCETDEASIMLPTEDGRELYVAAVRGAEREYVLGQRVSIDQGIAGWVACHGEPLTLHGEITDPRFSPVAPRPEILSAVSIPMLIGRKLVGVLNVNTTRQRSFTVGQVKALSIFALIAAAPLENARLYTQLRQAEAKYHSIVENVVQTAIDAIILADSEGKVIFWNQSAQKIFGYAADEILGQPLSTLMPERYRDAHQRGLERFKLTSKPHVIGRTVELHGLRKGGSEFPLELSLSNWQEGEEMFYTGVIRDTTEQKQLETQFRQAQKMEAVGRLAGGVAHDFNNLLTAILGFSEFAMRKLPPDSAFLRTDLEEIRNAAKRAATLTRQLLIFSRQQVTQPQRVDVNDLLRDLDKMLRRFIGEDIELVFVPAQELEAVMIDPGQLEQVVVNLVVNARDAMPTGGTLIIETGTAILDEEYARLHPEVTTGRYVMLTVSDTGTGMTEEVKSRLFEPFFTTKAAGKGTGLGLATCYGIVRQARGYIGVYSEPGQGTVFKVYLPCAEAAAPGQLPPVEKGGTLPRGTETVLLVEDDLSVRGMAVRVLQTQGYTVLEATDGEDALRLVQEYTGGRIRLVVTDVVMPRMSGRELVERLVTVYPGLKVLYMSGYTDDAIIRHGVLEEGTPFLQKPFTVTDLARRVREVMDAPQELKTGR